MDWLSVLPFIVVIVVAIKTKLVIPGLTAGLLTASFIYKPGVISGLQQFYEFIMNGLKDENNVKIILFLYMFTGLIGLMKYTGGIKGFVHLASSKIKTKKGALFLTWISTIGTFSAPSFRIVTVAPIMKALLNKVKITPQELGFVIETTATPVIVLMPIATAFVGYMSSVVQLSLKAEGIEGDGYRYFLQSIPYNFFSISIILIGFYLSFFHHSKKQATDAGNQEKELDDQWEDCHPAVSKDLPKKPFNLLLPLGGVILLTLFLTYWSGYEKGFTSLLQAFIEADVLDAMVFALLTTVLLTFLFYLFQRFSLKELVTFFIEGGNEMMPVIVLLTVVWGLASSTEALGFSTFVTSNLDWIPSLFVPPVLFLVGAFISYFIGSSWGTWGILMPLGISLGHSTGTDLPLVIGAVFASGTFGAFSSPLSDNTNTIARILKLNPMTYAKFKLTPALIAAGTAAVGYFIISFVI
ncbi:Na+/H+ antiporter NhaC family protein [Guptibacillus hwajinpoensis]|uniref:Na+/H+ antiporter NhaC family protein n=1 Tax=Guptibacillus hwajinpoensis TaxID=208199 RepID=UPI001CD31C19|nr:Na+/H+ antiporter NhaC family protein [Pseudalkalibacillus hwajinpoensis]MCA0990431.1 sodium:proton antiporter [Pseudalkalibacillus hwajinpoensis]